MPNGHRVHRLAVGANNRDPAGPHRPGSGHFTFLITGRSNRRRPIHRSPGVIGERSADIESGRRPLPVRSRQPILEPGSTIAAPRIGIGIGIALMHGGSHRPGGGDRRNSGHLPGSASRRQGARSPRVGAQVASHGTSRQAAIFRTGRVIPISVRGRKAIGLGRANRTTGPIRGFPAIGSIRGFPVAGFSRAISAADTRSAPKAVGSLGGSKVIASDGNAEAGGAVGRCPFAAEAGRRAVSRLATQTGTGRSGCASRLRAGVARTRPEPADVACPWRCHRAVVTGRPLADPSASGGSPLSGGRSCGPGGALGGGLGGGLRGGLGRGWGLGGVR
jgi:hypothetical protein